MLAVRRWVGRFLVVAFCAGLFWALAAGGYYLWSLLLAIVLGVWFVPPAWRAWDDHLAREGGR